MYTLRLQLFVIGLVLCIIALIVNLVRKEVIEYRYALLWIGASVLMLLTAIYPGLVMRVSAFLGFTLPANFLFLVGLFLLFLVTAGLTLSHSRASTRCRVLAQELALLKRRVEELERSN